MINPTDYKVALLSGGCSSEREISLASGQGAREALQAAGFRVECLDPANKEDLVKLISGNYDVAFLALHGAYGEDGTIQGLLELIGLPYTGSGVWSSATAIDKTKTKKIYQEYGINTPDFFVLKSKDNADKLILDRMGTECVIKANSQGSALGVYVCHHLDDIQHALDHVFSYDDSVLVESFISGEEYTCAVLGNKEAFALPLIKIVPKGNFYDFESKYSQGGSQHLCPAPVEDSIAENAQAIALDAHKALECKGVSRTDFILDDAGIFWTLETNTLPGLTSTSLLPDAARVAGISFPDLCTQLIEYALEKATD